MLNWQILVKQEKYAVDHPTQTTCPLDGECASQTALLYRVLTHRYRAPEVQLGSTSYNSPIDIWAIACIMAEVYTGRPLFPGRGTVDQIFKICSILGSPTHTTWSEGLSLANSMKIRMPVIVPTPLSSIVTNASDDGINVMTDMLQWDPRKRPTAAKVRIAIHC